jgi:hypothetical protein
MPFSPNTLRNVREEYVLENIEYFKVNEYIDKSVWKRHYFKSYRDAIKAFKNLRQSKRKVLIYACRDDKLGEVSTGINDRSIFKNV